MIGLLAEIKSSYDYFCPGKCISSHAVELGFSKDLPTEPYHSKCNSKAALQNSISSLFFSITFYWVCNLIWHLTTVGGCISPIPNTSFPNNQTLAKASFKLLMECYIMRVILNSSEMCYVKCETEMITEKQWANISQKYCWQANLLAITVNKWNYR